MSSTESDEKSTECPSNSDKSEEAFLGNGTFLIIVPRRRLTLGRKHGETLGTRKKYVDLIIPLHMLNHLDSIYH